MSVMRSPSAGRPLSVPIVIWIVSVHVLAAVALAYLILIRCSLATLALAVGLFFACHLSITAGTHRLYAHQAYTASKFLQIILLVFFAAVFQSSTLWWAAMHRRHHAYSDQADDPYSTLHGFWWAHMGWALRKPLQLRPREVYKLADNKLVLFQHKYHHLIGIVFGLALPTSVAGLWGDATGGFLAAGFLRLFFQYHCTWVINSVTHYYGTRRYETMSTARTTWWLAVLTVGESYHERHHVAERDYRLGTRWYDLDIGKWFIWVLARFGLAWNLQKVSEPDVLLRAERLAAQ